jgi:hypothetical protein
MWIINKCFLTEIDRSEKIMPNKILVFWPSPASLLLKKFVLDKCYHKIAAQLHHTHPTLDFIK